jgi:enoyl-CoA hydratase/carnithine racemase
MSEELIFEFLRYEHEGGIATITLNRPQVLNACNSAMHRELQTVIEQAELDPAVRVVLITGAGRAFCSGSDLSEVGQFRGVDARRYLRLDYVTKNRVAACSKPVIGVLHGHVAGGGFELALACDIRIVADNVLFSMPEIRLGTIPGAGGLQRLPQIVGMGIAKEWAFTGRRIEAAEAHLRGLANLVFPADRLMIEARAFAKDLAQRSTTALALAKTALDPTPPAADGLVGAYHTLASQVCHDDPGYAEQTERYVAGTHSL